MISTKFVANCGKKKERGLTTQALKFVCQQHQIQEPYCVRGKIQLKDKLYRPENVLPDNENTKQHLVMTKRIIKGSKRGKVKEKLTDLKMESKFYEGQKAVLRKYIKKKD